MKSILRVIILAAVFLLLTGCEKGHQIDLPPNSILRLFLYVETENGEFEIDYHELRRSDSHYQEIEEWLEKNSNGWRTYFATPALGRARIEATGFALVVNDDSVVLSYTDEGGEHEQLVRDIVPTEFEVLYGEIFRRR